MGVGAESPLALSKSAEPDHSKTAADLLEGESDLNDVDCALKGNDTNAGSEEGLVSSNIHYSPYDLLYLTDLASDSGSNYNSDDEDENYIQDF